MIRTFFALLAAVILLIISLPFGIVLWIFKKRDKFAPTNKLVSEIVMFFAKAVLWLAGVTYEIEGQENLPQDTAVFVGNHQGNFDVCFILFALGNPKIIMTKKEAAVVPIANIWMNLIKCIYVDRKNTRKAIAAMKLTEDYVKNGLDVLYFPEGTRSQGPDMGKFKGGAFKTAITTETQLVPFVIDGTYKVFEQQGYIKKGHVKFAILPPVAVSKDDDAKELTSRVQNMIQEKLDEMRK